MKTHHTRHKHRTGFMHRCTSCACAHTPSHISQVSSLLCGISVVGRGLRHLAPRGPGLAPLLCPPRLSPVSSLPPPSRSPPFTSLRVASRADSAPAPWEGAPQPCSWKPGALKGQQPAWVCTAKPGQRRAPNGQFGSQAERETHVPQAPPLQNTCGFRCRTSPIPRAFQ